MRSFLISFLFFFVAVLPACKGEDDKFSGVGKMIADRNRMRYEIAEEAGTYKGKTDSSDQQTDAVPKDGSGSVAPKQELKTDVLDEKNIVIVDISSGTPLGQGVAYLNKEGKIVKIKLADQ
ncbi:hypothetical protein [uncultured Desulfobacter sp.]|uniref:hypothetical protein n=1 Tax=uncultured Desulfobacter sp. TaxID=240139 RepID=UPI002AAB3C07|nr:hypothetical protein [uncultured Desulfobacter sp.]